MAEELWTNSQIAKINQRQESGETHPYTCRNRDYDTHRFTSDLGVLVATKYGWVCPDCDYTQEIR